MRKQELTVKQHAFAFNIVEGDGPSEAYRRAYAASGMTNEAVSVEAARLMRHPRVKARIVELHDTLQRSLGVSRATLMREIDDVMGLARGQNNVKVLLACVMAKAKLLGFIDAPARPRSANEPTFGEFDMDKVE